MSMSKRSTILRSMNSPENSATLPLEYAAELAFELHLLRGECGDVARNIINQENPDEAALEQCARLEDALAKAHSILGMTLHQIKLLRDRRSNTGN